MRLVLACVVLAATAATLPLALGGCDDGGAARCEALEDTCPLLTACDPQLGRCVAPDALPESQVTDHPALAIGSDGVLYLAAYAAAGGDLVFGVYDPVDARFRVQAVDTEGDVGHEPAIDLFPDGRPGIVYIDASSDQLKFAFYNERGVWQSETIDPQTRAADIDLAIDDDGSPHVAWRDTTNRVLRYARRVERRWKIENVDLGNDVPERIAAEEACPAPQRQAVGLGVGYGSRIAVQGSTPVISYHDADCGSLRIARGGADGQWSLRVLDGWSAERYAVTGPLAEPELRVGRFSDLAVDPLGQLVVAYFDATRGELRTANLEGTSELVDDGLRLSSADERAVKHVVGQQPSVAFDTTGRPVVAHLDAASLALLVSTQRASTWSTEPLPAGPQGFDNDLAIGPDGTRYLVGVNRARSDGPRVELTLLPPPP